MTHVIDPRTGQPAPLARIRPGDLRQPTAADLAEQVATLARHRPPESAAAEAGRWRLAMVEAFGRYSDRARALAATTEPHRPAISSAALGLAEALDRLREDPESPAALDAVDAAQRALDVSYRPAAGAVEVRSSSGQEPSLADVMAEIKALREEVAKLTATSRHPAAPPVETRPVAVERRGYNVPESDRQRRSEHARTVLNVPRQSKAQAKRAEVFRLAQVALGTPNTASAGRWTLPDDLDELMVVVFDAWSLEPEKLVKPSARSIREWLDDMISLGDLVTPG